MFRKQLEKQQLKGSLPESVVHVSDRVANAEATLLAFTAEHSLSLKVVPDLISLSKELARDKHALDRLSVDRTSASYKMKYGLAKTFEEELLEDLKQSYFSLNIDECTSETNHRVVTVLVSYFSLKEEKVVTKHLSSFSVTKVDSATLYNELVKLFEKFELPWKNLVSILMDSCAVMRGSKSGLETQIRNFKAPHLLDVDGDSCHHAHNASKSFCKPFDNYIESLLNDIYTDFKWSSDQKEVLHLICDAVGIKGTVPERYVPHRWLSVYDVCVDTSRMLDALVLFYYSFVSATDRAKHLSLIQEVYSKHGTSKSTQKAIETLQDKVGKKVKTMTQLGKERKNRIVKKMFDTQKRTKVILHIYSTILPMLKKYVMLFQMTNPLIHKLNDKQQELLRDFLSCFIKPELLNNQPLHTVDISEKNMLPDSVIFLVSHINKYLKKSDLVHKLKTGYLNCAKTLQSKMPVNNQLLKCASAIDPACRGHTITIQYLLKLPSLLPNVLEEDKIQSYDEEVRRYNIDKDISMNTDSRIDSWWGALQGKYPHMAKIMLALISCFHGPQVESSFSIMGQMLNSDRPNLQISTFAAMQTVKYEMRSADKTALEYFWRKDYLHDPVSSKLCKNMARSYKTYVEVKEMEKEELEAKRKATGVQIPKQGGSTSKKQARQSAMLSADRAKKGHEVKLVRKDKLKTNVKKRKAADEGEGSIPMKKHAGERE